MPRLTLEIPDHQHARFKAEALANGMKLEEFALDSMSVRLDKRLNLTRSELERGEALDRAKEELLPALRSVQRGETYRLTTQDIIKEARAEKSIK